MMKHKIILILLALFVSEAIYSQEKTSLNQAILIALENNRNIKVSQNSVIITENLSSLGQAGLLPSLNASGLIDYGNDNTKTQIRGTTNTIEKSGIESTIYSASINFNYTIFSGFGNKRTFDKLKTNIDLADAENRVFVENIILQVAANYYNVIRTEENYKALLESIEISHKRYDLAKAKFEYSGGTKLSLLNVKVDLSKDSVILYDAQLAMENSRIAFNRVISIPLDSNLDLINDFVPENNYIYEQLKEQMIEQNSQLMSIKYREQVSLLDYKIVKSSYSPTLSLGGSYAYFNSSTDNSIYDINQAHGPGINLSLSIPIYNGGRRNAALKNTKIIMENTSLQAEDLALQLEMELLIAYKDYLNALRKVKIEGINVETATQNFQLTEEKYKLGQVINTTFREAQYNLIVTKNNYNNSIFNAKLAELEIIKLSGLLLNKNK
ncbi:MAG: TolC family protein [Bacteroidales bacterium]|nr:TolC family protein [Bacteroidales bacterium]